MVSVSITWIAVAAASQVFLHGRQAAFSFGFAATIVLVRGGVFFQGMPTFVPDPQDWGGYVVISNGSAAAERRRAGMKLIDDACLLGVAVVAGLVACTLAKNGAGANDPAAQ